MIKMRNAAGLRASGYGLRLTQIKQIFWDYPIGRAD